MSVNVITKGTGSVGRLLVGAALVFTNAGAPTSGTSGTGVGKAGPGSLLIDTTNKKLYQNTNTKASPTWQSVGDIAAAEITLARGHVLVGNSSGVAVAVDANNSGQILVGDGTDLVSVAVSGDATLAANGALTLAETLIRYATVTLTNTQVLALRATPVTLVAAPGANKLIQFLGGTLNVDGTAGAFTETDDNLAIRYVDGSGVIASEAIETTAFIDQAGKMITNAVPKKDVILTEAQGENAALVLHNTGNGEFGGGNAANTLKVTIAYRIVGTL